MDLKNAAPERRAYARPPIQEVVIQVGVQPSLLANAALPGQLYEGVKNDYPEEVATEFQAQLLSVSQGSEGTPALSQAMRFIFSAQASNRKLILTNNFMTVNALSPYEGWESLAARFEKAALALFHAKPDLTALNVSIRYINKIEIPSRDINTDDYFTVPIRTAEESTAPFLKFNVEVQSPLEDDRTSCVMRFASVLSGDEKPLFTLDLELTTPVDESLAADPTKWREVLEDLHRRENAEFESLITEKTRELFL